MARSIVNGDGNDNIRSPEVTSAGVDNLSLGALVYLSATSLSALVYHGANMTGLGVHFRPNGSLDILYGGIDWAIGGSYSIGWQSVILIRSGGTAQLYVNGSVFGASDATAPNALDGTGFFECFGDGTGEIRFAEAFFYNRVLSSAEIAKIGAGYSPAFFPNGLQRYTKITGANTPDPLETGGSVTLTDAANTPKVTHPDFVRYPGNGPYSTVRPRPFAPGLAR